jgi:predicted ATPase
MSNVSDAELLTLENRADTISKVRRSKSDLAPLVVEFSGSPKSGKSTNIDVISHFLKRMGFKIWAPTEGASKRTPSNLRRDLVAFNTWSLNYAISELLVAYHNVDRPDLVILDRGPFDSLAWMGVLRDKKQLTKREYLIVREFALHPKWSKLINQIYLFTCTPEVSLEREHRVTLTRKPGTAMNVPMLSGLLEQYQQLKAELADYPVESVDTTSTSGPIATAYPIVMKILDLFEAQQNGH